MRADMEFPQDQLIMFKALDAGGGVVARYGLFDLGSGTVDNVTVAQTVKSGVASFLYFYDVPNRKSVIVTFEGRKRERNALLPSWIPRDRTLSSLRTAMSLSRICLILRGIFLDRSLTGGRTTTMTPTNQPAPTMTTAMKRRRTTMRTARSSLTELKI